MLPVQRKSRSQSKMRRSHNAVKLSRLQAVACPNCGAWKRSHAACRECGYVRPGLRLELSKEE